jgi:predicted nucleic acid-binding protein
VIVHLDTSVLVTTLADPVNVRRLHTVAERGDRPAISSMVLFEWLRGPRLPAQLHVVDALFPEHSIVTFSPPAARVAAGIYAAVRRPRSREADIVIAACAIEHGAALWTLNPSDFEDIPGLTLYRA